MLLRESDAQDAVVVAERLRIEIANRFAGNRGSPTVTASLGVAAIPSDAIDAKTLIAAADKALYAAKAAGRNCVVRASSTRVVHVRATRGRSRPTSVPPSPVVVTEASTAS